MTTFKWHFWKRTHTGGWRLWKWKGELKYSHSSQKSTADIPHFYKWKSVFWSCHTTHHSWTILPNHSPWQFRSHSPLHHHLVFTSSDDESPVRTSDPCLQQYSTQDDSPLHRRAEPPSQLQHHMDYHHISTPSTDDSFQNAMAEEEDFPIAPLDDDIWLEYSVPDRHLCIHEQPQPHYQCSYPCPSSLNLLHSAPEDALGPYYEMMELSDISDLQDMMTTTREEDIPDQEDIFRLWIWTMVWINVYAPWTLSIWTNAKLYKTTWRCEL